MKKIILLFSALLLAGTIFAQQKAYLSLGVGAGLGTARTYDLYNGLKVHPVGLGKGLDFNLRGGYFVGQAIAIELGVGYRMGLNTKVDLEEEMDAYQSYGGSGTLKFKSDMLYLVPAVVISPDFESKTRPYARLGVLIGIMPSMTTKMDITTTSYPYDALAATDNTVATIKYSGGVAFGGSFALGCDFNLSDLLAIYAEIYYDALSYAPTKGEFKKCELNGKDVLPDMTTYDKEVEFVKDLTGFVPKDSEPDQQLKKSYPLNSLGLNIGLKIKL